MNNRHNEITEITEQTYDFNNNVQVQQLFDDIFETVATSGIPQGRLTNHPALIGCRLRVGQRNLMGHYNINGTGTTLTLHFRFKELRQPRFEFVDNTIPHDFIMEYKGNRGVGQCVNLFGTPHVGLYGCLSLNDGNLHIPQNVCGIDVANARGFFEWGGACFEHIVGLKAFITNVTCVWKPSSLWEVAENAFYKNEDPIFRQQLALGCKSAYEVYNLTQKTALALYYFDDRFLIDLNLVICTSRVKRAAGPPSGRKPTPGTKHSPVDFKHEGLNIKFTVFDDKPKSKHYKSVANDCGFVAAWNIISRTKNDFSDGLFLEVKQFTEKCIAEGAIILDKAGMWSDYDLAHVLAHFDTAAYILTGDQHPLVPDKIVELGAIGVGRPRYTMVHMYDWCGSSGHWAVIKRIWNRSDDAHKFEVNLFREPEDDFCNRITCRHLSAKFKPGDPCHSEFGALSEAIPNGIGAMFATSFRQFGIDSERYHNRVYYSVMFAVVSTKPSILRYPTPVGTGVKPSEPKKPEGAWEKTPEVVGSTAKPVGGGGGSSDPPKETEAPKTSGDDHSSPPPSSPPSGPGPLPPLSVLPKKEISRKLVPPPLIYNRYFNPCLKQRNPGCLDFIKPVRFLNSFISYKTQTVNNPLLRWYNDQAYSMFPSLRSRWNYAKSKKNLDLNKTVVLNATIDRFASPDERALFTRNVRKQDQFFLSLKKGQYVQDSITFHDYTHPAPDEDMRPDHMKGPELKHDDPLLGHAVLRKWVKIEDLPEDQKSYAVKYIVSEVVDLVEKSLCVHHDDTVKHSQVLAVLQSIGSAYWLKTTVLVYSREMYSQVMNHSVAVLDETIKIRSDWNSVVKQACLNAGSRINIDRYLVLEGVNVISDTTLLITEVIEAKRFHHTDLATSNKYYKRPRPVLRGAGARLGMIGYASTDLTFEQIGKKLDDIKDGKIEDVAKFQYEREVKDAMRRIVSVNPGMQIPGFAAPRPDTGHSGSAKEGLQKRLMGTTFEPEFDYYKDLENYTKLIFDHEKWGEKLLNDDDNIRYLTDFEFYLSKTNYSEKLKKKFREIRGEVIETANRLSVEEFQKWCEVKCFVKEEAYDEPKFHRGIYARSDYFKVIFGPYVKLMEKCVFSSTYFVKKIPVKDRHDWLLNKLYMDGALFGSTDFTGFEKHSIPRLMRVTVHKVYDLFARYIEILTNGCDANMLGLCAKVLRGMNNFVFKYFKASFPGGKCSGEMDTSLSNGLLNFIMMVFILEREGYHTGFGYFNVKRRPGCYNGILPCCFEGDDGNISFPYDLDISDITPALFKRYGLDLKIEKADKVGEAGFVCLYFNEVTPQLITNPFKHLARMWVSSRYIKSKETKIRSLMRMKCMCLLYQFPSCPILAAYCEMVLRLTAGYDVRHLYYSLDAYDRDRFSFLVDGTKMPYKRGHITELTRDTCHNLFGVCPELQKTMENYFDSQTEWSQYIDPPGFDLITPPKWIDNWRDYVCELNVHSVTMNEDILKVPIRPVAVAASVKKTHESIVADDSYLDKISEVSAWLAGTSVFVG